MARAVTNDLQINGVRTRFKNLKYEPAFKGLSQQVHNLGAGVVSGMSFDDTKNAAQMISFDIEPDSAGYYKKLMNTLFEGSNSTGLIGRSVIVSGISEGTSFKFKGRAFSKVVYSQGSQGVQTITIGQED